MQFSLVIAAVLAVVLAAAHSYRAEAHIIAGVFGISGVAALVGSRGRHLSWVVLLAIAALVWFSFP